MAVTKPLGEWQKGRANQAVRELKHGMQKLVDKGDVGSVTVRVGDGPELVVAGKRDAANEPEIAEALREVLDAPQADSFDELDYSRSEEVEAVARNLVDRHAMTLGHVNDFAIVYLLRHVAGEIDEVTIDALAKAIKAPAIWRDTYGVDAAIWVDKRWWDRFSEMEREAVVLHELLHIGVNDKDRLKILDHDVEEFGMVVRLYGPWRPDLSRFGKQLDLFTNAATS